MPAAGAAVAPDRDQQRRRPPPERLVRQPADRGVARSAFAAAAAAPLVSFDHPARQHRPLRLNTLPDRLQAKLVKATEGRQISAAEAGAGGSVVHVEVFQMSV